MRHRTGIAVFATLVGAVGVPGQLYRGVTFTPGTDARSGQYGS